MSVSQITLTPAVEVCFDTAPVGGGVQPGRQVPRNRERKTARFWSTALDDVLHQLCTGHGRNLSPDEWRRYLGDLAWQPTCESWPTRRIDPTFSLDFP